MLYHGQGGRGGSHCMWGLHWRKAEVIRRLGFLMIIIIIIIIILFYLWRRRAPQLLLPDSSSSPPLSLSPSVSAGRSWNPPARPEREQGGKGGDGGDQRPRDHARAVTAAASRAPSPRSTSNNPAARGSGTLVRRRPPGPGACAGARRARSPGQV